MAADSTVFVVDDDDDARASVCALTRSMRLTSRGFSSAEEFLSTYKDSMPGCLVTDVRMFGMSGIELQEELNRRGCRIPVIVLTAFARTPLTVRAMRNGAVTMLDKPYSDDDLWDAIRQALSIDDQRRQQLQHARDLARRYARLTPAEQQVMSLVVSGQLNKVIADQLDVSVRTVENRRAQVFEKMEAGSVAELVQFHLVLRESGAIDDDQLVSEADRITPTA